MKLRNRILASSLILLLAAFSVAVSSENAACAEKRPQISFLLCPMGCGSTEGNLMLANVLEKKGYPFVLNAQETPGYIYNLREMAGNPKLWKNTIFSTEDDLVAYALFGGKGEIKDFFPEPITTKWKILYGEGRCTAGTFYQTTNPNIKSVADLKGKRIGLGLRPQSCWGMDAYLILSEGYGINTENSKIFFLGPGKAADELLNGKVDAIMMGFITNHDGTAFNISPISRTLEAAGRDIFYLAPEQAVYQKLNEKFGSFKQPLTVPAGTLPKQKGPLTVGADITYNVAHESFPEELAYQLVKAVATQGVDLQSSHAYWKCVTPLDMVNGLSEENTHPGAIKAFKELNVWDKRKQFKPTEVKVFK